MADAASGVTILVLVGSLRSASVNRRVAELAVDVAPEGVTLTVFDGLADVPFYNEDIDTPGAAPASAVALRTAAAAADAALVVTPEYNGTIPAVIKNAIDWLSRPFGDGALKDKPLAVIGASAGRYGGVWAHDEIRKSAAIAGTRVIESVKLSLPIPLLEGKSPREHAGLAADVRDVVGKLAAEVG